MTNELIYITIALCIIFIPFIYRAVNNKLKPITTSYVKGKAYITDKGQYIDKQGYLRDNIDNRLVHRTVAYLEIYLPNRKKYPLRFREYVVHHKDKNRLNNHKSNLRILTPEQHKKYHKHLR